MLQKDNDINLIEVIISPDTIFFFDMDGTLIDTDYANFLAYQKAVYSVTKSDYNIVFNPLKRFNRSDLKSALPNLSECEYVKIIQEKENCYDNFLSEVKLNSNIVEIFLKYSQTHKTVLVTNCRKERAVKTLNHFGLLEKFSNVFYRHFAENEQRTNKFQNAILNLGVNPLFVIAFEDEVSEIEDAKKAGIRIINPTNFK